MVMIVVTAAQTPYLVRSGVGGGGVGGQTSMRLPLQISSSSFFLSFLICRSLQSCNSPTFFFLFYFLALPSPFLL